MHARDSPCSPSRLVTQFLEYGDTVKIETLGLEMSAASYGRAEPDLRARGSPDRFFAPFSRVSR